MNIRELIEKLSKLDPDLDVLCYAEEASLLPEGHGFQLLAIDAVATTGGVRTDGRHHFPQARQGSYFGDSGRAGRHFG
jgi:hypothetical protein